MRARSLEYSIPSHFLSDEAGSLACVGLGCLLTEWNDVPCLFLCIHFPLIPTMRRSYAGSLEEASHLLSIKVSGIRRVTLSSTQERNNQT